MRSAHFLPNFVPPFALAAGITLAGGCNAAPPVPRSNSAPGDPLPPMPGADDGGAGGSSLFFVDAGPPPPPLTPPLGPRPSFGTTVTARTPPPPISGGTLLVTHDGKTTVAADPDRDTVYVIDVAARAVTFSIALSPGDEPGRVAEDGAGRVHVALRGGGALVTIDPTAGKIVERRTVCPAPRGVAWDVLTDLVWVACATGELVAFPSGGGAATHSFVVERDLRDVIIQNGSIAVTKFRSAEVLRLAGDGTVSRRDSLPATTLGRRGTQPGSSSFVSHVAWRAVAGSSGSILVVHEDEDDSPIDTQAPSAYAAGGPVMQSEITVLASDGTIAQSQVLSQLTLPVDVALSPDGAVAAVVSAGNAFSPLPTLGFDQLIQTPAPPRVSPSISNSQPIAIAFDAAGDLLVQSRQPAILWVAPATTGTPTPIALSTTSRDDTGHDIFHTQAGGLIACASCHPEGGDDGHVWLPNGAPRRTPSLRGTIAGTAPYHWPGDEADLTVLAKDVYTGRMSGAELDAPQMRALTAWVESIPAPPAPSWVDASAAHRGRALFAGASGCANCHSGTKLTNNATVAVGTGGTSFLPAGGGTLQLEKDTTTFQIPSLLGVGWRTPLLHDGCAVTIADRFGKCSTPAHGSTAQLSPQDISDLTAYLESL